MHDIEKIVQDLTIVKIKYLIDNNELDIDDYGEIAKTYKQVFDNFIEHFDA